MFNYKKNINKKGFTLIEIIVVLVIIAVLAASAIPTMIGFVEDSKGKAEIANARAAYIACQAIVTEEYAIDGENINVSGDYMIGEEDLSPGKENIHKKLNQMLETDLDGANVTIDEIDYTSGKVKSIVYSSPSKDKKYYYMVTIEEGKTATVEKVTL